jgi:hypothetical protein
VAFHPVYLILMLTLLAIPWAAILVAFGIGWAARKGWHAAGGARTERLPASRPEGRSAPGQVGALAGKPYQAAACSIRWS